MDMDAMAWVERLGGWAVVCYMVLWLTKRLEVKMTEMTEALNRTNQIQSKLVDAQNTLVRELKAVLEQVTKHAA